MRCPASGASPGRRASASRRPSRSWASPRTRGAGPGHVADDGHRLVRPVLRGRVLARHAAVRPADLRCRPRGGLRHPDGDRGRRPARGAADPELGDGGRRRPAERRARGPAAAGAAEDAAAGVDGRPAAEPGGLRRLRPGLRGVRPDPRRPPRRARAPRDHPDHPARARLRARRRVRVAVPGRGAAAGRQLRHPGPLLLRRDAAARRQPAAQRDPRRTARSRR